MVQLLDQSRIVKQSIPETSVATAIGSTRLTVLPTHKVSTSRKTKPPKKKKKPEFDADDVNQPIKSSHTLRMQWEGMPEDGPNRTVLKNAPPTIGSKAENVYPSQGVPPVERVGKSSIG
ncbi:hypothetical protein PPTG_24165 [Phytophthora nicotianae INRA-310]|uniref:Uncharacterized protein n=1 Tax=Phytophthora nicotianae (strain INRA-310) TaxID=761204 RepID=W2PJ60_PHYN3|nr:hypothetical protein PPTG_24165 [Phytophthora nicotianae INRA-310]ETN00892.1 hypothetical protein PPTG_24165 [Phytophthora nicotianae INRA-310]